jgi:hypothetical protein
MRASSSASQSRFIDTIVFPTEVDLRILRSAAALAGVASLLYAFIWESE